MKKAEEKKKKKKQRKGKAEKEKRGVNLGAKKEKPVGEEEDVVNLLSYKNSQFYNIHHTLIYHQYL